jgi:hypothetical protein
MATFTLPIAHLLLSSSVPEYMSEFLLLNYFTALLPGMKKNLQLCTKPTISTHYGNSTLIPKVIAGQQIIFRVRYQSAKRKIPNLPATASPKRDKIKLPRGNRAHFNLVTRTEHTNRCSGTLLLGSASNQPCPIRNTLVPHTGQTPLTAGLPFFKVTFCGSLISLFALHLKQYACTSATSYQVTQLQL